MRFLSVCVILSLLTLISFPTFPPRLHAPPRLLPGDAGLRQCVGGAPGDRGGGAGGAAHTLLQRLPGRGQQASAGTAAVEGGGERRLW